MSTSKHKEREEEDRTILGMIFLASFFPSFFFLFSSNFCFSRKTKQKKSGVFKGQNKAALEKKAKLLRVVLLLLIIIEKKK